jgi:hypothetical protein
MMKQIGHKSVVHLMAWDVWSKWAAPLPVFLVLGHNKWAAPLPVFFWNWATSIWQKIAPVELRTLNQEVCRLELCHYTA